MGLLRNIRRRKNKDSSSGKLGDRLLGYNFGSFFFWDSVGR